MSKTIPCVTLLKPGEWHLGDICHVYRQVSISATAEQRALSAGALPKVLLQSEQAQGVGTEAPLPTNSGLKRDWTRVSRKGSTYCLFPIWYIPEGSQVGFKVPFLVDLRNISVTYTPFINSTHDSDQVSHKVAWGKERNNWSNIKLSSYFSYSYPSSSIPVRTH